MKLEVRVEGDGGPMELSRTESGWRFEWQGRSGEASAVEVEPGVWSIVRDGRAVEARVSSEGVWIAGRLWRTDVVDPREGSARTDSAGRHGPVQVTAPMPGKVIRALVAEGDEVAAGQGLLVVEAMKMQNEMQSPKAGRVSSLRAREGAAVAAGEVLAVIE